MREPNRNHAVENKHQPVAYGRRTDVAPVSVFKGFTHQVMLLMLNQKTPPGGN